MGWGREKKEVIKLIYLFPSLCKHVTKAPESRGHTESDRGWLFNSHLSHCSISALLCMGHYIISLEWKGSNTIKGKSLSLSFTIASSVPE